MGLRSTPTRRHSSSRSPPGWTHSSAWNGWAQTLEQGVATGGASAGLTCTYDTRLKKWRATDGKFVAAADVEVTRPELPQGAPPQTALVKAHWATETQRLVAADGGCIVNMRTAH